MMKKIITASLATAALAIGLTVLSVPPAYAGDNHICDANGTSGICLTFTAAQVGRPVFTTDPQNGPRNLYWEQTGTDSHGNIEGYIETYNGMQLAEQGCNSNGIAIVSGEGDTGVVWIRVFGNGYTNIVNRHCDNGNYTYTMADENLTGHSELVAYYPGSGLFHEKTWSP